MTWEIAAVLAAGIGFPAAFVAWVAYRLILSRRDDWQRELAAAREQRDLAEESRRLREQIIDQLELDLAQAKSRQQDQSLATALRRADEYRRLIEVVQQERNKWQDLYFSQAAGHDTAQQMLMRELERVTLLYQQETKQALPITPSAKVVRQAYLDAHGGAIEEYRTDQGAARKAEKEEEEAREVKRIEQPRPE